MSSRRTAACTRCGIVREINPARESTGLCADCRAVEWDLAHGVPGVPRHGTNSGYMCHVRGLHGWPRIACDDCLAAHNAALTAWRRRTGRHSPAKQAKCGTYAGYQRHNQTLRETPCDDCKAAKSAYERARYHARRAA